MPTTQKAQSPVDLFGNSRLTPRQVLDQQLSELMQETDARTANLGPRERGTSQLGAAFGGLLRNSLISAGVLPKPPEVERAERLEAAREKIKAAAAEQGLDMTKDPVAFGKLSAGYLLEVGEEEGALRAIQFSQLHEAAREKKELTRQQINTAAANEAKDLGVFTPESRQAFIKGERKDPSVLVLDPEAKDKGRGEYFVPVQTAEGVVAFDARRGITLDPSTKQPIKRPVVGSTSDPALQRRLSAGKKSGEKLGEETADLDGKFDALDALQGAQDMLNKGIHSGYWANWKQTASKVGAGSKEKAANTERFQSYIGNTVIPRLKEFGGNDTVEEMKYLQKVQAGEITMEPAALKSIVAEAERKLTRRVTSLRKKASAVGLPTDEPPAPRAPGSAIREGTTATNPQTGKRVVFKGGQWQPVK